MPVRNQLPIFAIVLLFLAACKPQPADETQETNELPVTMQRTGWLVADELMEASGMQASRSREGDFFLHNDEGAPVLYVTDKTGADLGSFSIVPAKNKDWEDITSVPVDGGRWIVAGDIGDNQARRKSIRLYFAQEPKPGKHDRYDGFVELKHRLTLTYPDGPRDCESLAYDPVAQQLLLLSKRDKPPRLYAVDLATALTQPKTELEFLGTIARLRPPTAHDRRRFGGRTDFISQPTGLDISADGSEAVVITYRSLYRFRRDDGESWLSALQKEPQEVVGPPAPQNEAIAYSVDGTEIYVTTEKQPAPVFQFIFTD